MAPVAAPRPSSAEGILLPAPVRGAELLAALDESGGSVVTVSEPEIAEGVRALGARGLAVEPTSAVVWKGLARLREQQSVRDGDRVVAILSAHGLKATAAIERLLEPP